MVMRRTGGFTLIEMLIAMVVFMGVMAGALSFLTAQSRGFRKGDEEMSTLLNMSYGADHLHAQLRTTGARTLDRQPPIVYASANSYAFNADYVSNDASDISAVYIDPDAPGEETVALRLADQITVPGSTPAFLYPSQDYTELGINSLAETITLFFQPDAETTRADDFVLLRQVNGQPPERLVRNVLRDSTNLPFFRYYKLRVPGPGLLPVTSLVPAAELPMSHTIPGHGTTADAGAPIDSLRAVLVSYVITNGYTGARERQQRISVTIPLPNMGLRELKICGSAPVFGQVLTAVYDNATGVDRVLLSWSRSFDENQGERDVVRYVLWRRDVADPDWSDPLTSIPVADQADYTYTDAQDLVQGTTYVYSLSAQDCTPRLSPSSTSNQVTIPAP
jgi:prepilin-type N-terminal cleavage/methylation domain-containing protein